MKETNHLNKWTLFDKRNSFSFAQSCSWVALLCLAVLFSFDESNHGGLECTEIQKKMPEFERKEAFSALDCFFQICNDKKFQNKV